MREKEERGINSLFPFFLFFPSFLSFPSLPSFLPSVLLFFYSFLLSFSRPVFFFFYFLFYFVYPTSLASSSSLLFLFFFYFFSFFFSFPIFIPMPIHSFIHSFRYPVVIITWKGGPPCKTRAVVCRRMMQCALLVRPKNFFFLKPFPFPSLPSPLPLACFLGVP